MGCCCRVSCCCCCCCCCPPHLESCAGRGQDEELAVPQPHCARDLHQHAHQGSLAAAGQAVCRAAQVLAASWQQQVAKQPGAGPAEDGLKHVHVVGGQHVQELLQGQVGQAVVVGSSVSTASIFGYNCILRCWLNSSWPSCHTLLYIQTPS
jgi:hypothetical protein